MARTVPTSASAVPGQFITGALWNAQVKALNDFLTAPPVFSGYQTTAQSIPNATFTSFTLDTEVVDSDGGHSTTTNTSRYTATVPGTYLVVGTAGWSGATTGYRRCRITLNGGVVPGAAVGTDATNAVLCGQSVTAIVVMNGTTDYVEVQGAQSSGAALAAYNQDFAPSMRVYWLSR
ncbi:hypothetical protein FHS39_002601 [Streptomyces olivoverticillatus]|uniref:C1q domain-containing protein n=1 Tax=Streptomyces olivoverticillatus TaxID=66427 RepID=A0A7W7PM93_9ACTN|nr:hypothetical protein [Streptomyces olivoverticillatus]MBB4893570.1 hypothetical protein [Streptomyces olivoverticillatus]